VGFGICYESGRLGGVRGSAALDRPAHESSVACARQDGIYYSAGALCILGWGSMYFTSAMNLLSFVSKKEKKKKMGSIVVHMGNHDEIDYSANKKSSMRREPVLRIHLFPLLMLFVFFILWAGSTSAQFFRLERFPIPQSVGLAQSVFMFFFFWSFWGVDMTSFCWGV
jgi:hypothetical protein